MIAIAIKKLFPTFDFFITNAQHLVPTVFTKYLIIAKLKLHKRIKRNSFSGQQSNFSQITKVDLLVVFVVKRDDSSKDGQRQKCQEIILKREKITNCSAFTTCAHLQISLVELCLYLRHKCHTYSLITDVRVNKG